MSFRPPDEFDVRGDDTWSLSAPSTPAGVQVTVGVRWVKVTWQPPQGNADAPVADYLLAVSPGSQTIRFDAQTTETVLIALKPEQVYSVFVAARNAAGSSGWISSPEFSVSYAVDTPPQGHALIDAQLFEDLLLLHDDALRVWLDSADDADLDLAISSLPLPQRRRVIGCVSPAERAAPLREKFLPPPSTAITRPVTAQPVPVKPPPDPQPVAPRPEIVIEAPLPRRRLNFWWIALPVALTILLVLALLWRPVPSQDRADLAATVAALAAAQTTVQPTPSSVFTSTAASTPMATPTPPTVTSAPTQPLADTPALARPAVDLVNVRSGPGEDYAVRGLIPAGEDVTLLARNDVGDWLYVSFDNAIDNVEGWVASWLLTLPDGDVDLSLRATPPLPTPTVIEESVVVADPPTAQATTPAVVLVTETLTQTATSVAVAAPTEDALTASPCLTGGAFWLIHPVEIGV
ncbi:MAG: SH3 domain-containing protein, partial [Caldilineaceae bacterium]|nr:SH3 domain-containing protein [Caldilineaceae bacterium]